MRTFDADYVNQNSHKNMQCSNNRMSMPTRVLGCVRNYSHVRWIPRMKLQCVIWVDIYHGKML